jgi:hypothetical protein
MDQDFKVPKSRFVKSKCFSCSRWLINFVSFLEGLRPNKLQLTTRHVCRVQRVSGQPKTDTEYGIERGADCL